MTDGLQEILPDIPRYHTALAEWLSCLMVIMHIKRRMEGRRAMAACGCALVLQVFFLEATGGLETAWWLPCMFVAIAMMVALVYVCGDVDWKDAAYYGAYAFIMAETAASLEWQLYLFGYGKHAGFIREIVGNTGDAVAGALDAGGIFTSALIYECGVLALSYAAIFFLYWRLCAMLLEKEERLGVEAKDLLTVALLTGSVFFVSNLGFVTGDTPFSGLYAREIFNIRTFADIAGLAALFAYHVQWRDQKVRRELESIRNILHNQYVQYEQSRRTLELINFKYHDLKHYIVALQAEGDGQRGGYLEKLKEEIQQYEVQNKTGNKVLDTLLTAKGMECQREKIELTCVADGTLLEFMEVMDICSIFGNALDNAIECEKKISDPEKRMIHLRLSSKHNFVMIKIENYYEGSIRFEQDLPVTTKGDKEYHGYGLKSLKYTVHQYHGEVDIRAENHWFSLRILIPIPF